MRFLAVLILLACQVGLSMSPSPAAASEGRLPVTVSILPQKYFVERIGGDRVEVSVMVPAGASAHTYEPRPRQMATLTGSRIYFATGIEFEGSWLPRFRAANPRMRVIHLDAGIDKIAGCGDCGVSHSSQTAPTDSPHAPDAQGQDPHIWLAPGRVALQARHILEALRAEDPDHSATYTRNYVRFLGELGRLEDDLREIFAAAAGPEAGPVAFMIYHPAYGYLAEEFGLEQIAIEVDGKEPGPQQLRQQIDAARERGVRKVFIQPQQSTRAARTVAQALGAEVVEVDPYAEAWPDELRRVARLIAEAQPAPSRRATAEPGTSGD